MSDRAAWRSLIAYIVCLGYALIVVGVQYALYSVLYADHPLSNVSTSVGVLTLMGICLGWWKQLAGVVAATLCLAFSALAMNELPDQGPGSVVLLLIAPVTIVAAHSVRHWLKVLAYFMRDHGL